MPSQFAHLYPVILCGGADVRLWPLSRDLAPRQLMTVTGESESLLSAAVRRCLPLTDNSVCVITDESLADEVGSHLVGQGVIVPERLDLLVEPTSRGTAFAIALAAACLAERDPAAVMLVVPATHHVEEDDRWSIALTRAFRVASTDRIGIVGTTPTNETTNHPLVVPGKGIDGIVGASLVARYLLKPTPAQVQRNLKAGALWDTGVFMARASLILSEIRRCAAMDADVSEAEAERLADTAGFLAYLGRDNWANDDARRLVESLPAVSFERAVIEHTTAKGVVASSVEWSSISTLKELDELGLPGPSGNRTFGKTVPINTNGSTIFAGGDRLVTTLGVRDTLVVDTPDALLVADKRSLSGVSSVVNALRDINAPEVSRPLVRPMPWGTETTLRREGAFSVERLQILAGHHTPPEKRPDRQMQITAIAGKGTVRLDTHTKQAAPGDSFGVRPGVRIIITNTGDEPFVLIAVVQDLNYVAHVDDEEPPEPVRREMLDHEVRAQAEMGLGRALEVASEEVDEADLPAGRGSAPLFN